MGAVLGGWASIIVGSWAGLWDDVQMGAVEGEWVGLVHGLRAGMDA